MGYVRVRIHRRRSGNPARVYTYICARDDVDYTIIMVSAASAAVAPALAVIGDETEFVAGTPLSPLPRKRTEKKKPKNKPFCIHYCTERACAAGDVRRCT